MSTPPGARCLKLVHSTPLTSAELLRRRAKPSCSKQYLETLEQRLIDIAILLESSESERSEQADVFATQTQEHEAKRAQLIGRIEELEGELLDTRAALQTVISARHALLSRAQNVSAHLDKVLGFEHADESLAKYELRRAFCDLLEAFDDEG